MPDEKDQTSNLKSSEYLTFGGLAVLEGVMMRSPRFYSIACRAPNGKIVVRTEPLSVTWIGRQKWLKLPFLRGTLALLDTMALGNRAMNWAAEIQSDSKFADKSSEFVEDKTAKPVNKSLEKFLLLGAVVIGLAVQFIVFRGLPEFIAEFLVRAWTNSPNKNLHLTGTNYLAEVIKVLLFIVFLALIAQSKTTKEIFRYHGAEHKAINTIEASCPLNFESVNQQTRLHPRCGTNFLIIITLIAFLVFPAIPRDLFVPATSPSWLIALSRLPLQLVVLPILAGISYEVIRAAGKAKDQKWVNIILKPGLMTQLITTAEPAEKHIEVAIVALQSVMKAEDGGELNNSEDYQPLS